MKNLLLERDIQEIYFGNISFTYRGAIAQFKPTDRPHINLPTIPIFISGIINNKVPLILTKSARIITYLLPIIFSRELILSAANSAATAIESLNNPWYLNKFGSDFIL